MKNLLIALFAIVSFCSSAQQEFYELRTYEMKFGGNSGALHSYLKDAYIPAVKKHGAISVGVFNEYGLSNPAKLYVLTVYQSILDYDKAYEALKTDETFLASKEVYDKLPNDKVPYNRISIAMYKAFSGIPKLVKPVSGTSVFELRTYEGINEAAYARKIKMFNQEEIALFKETKLHSVFFGEMLAGTSAPALTYLLGFKDMAERDTNWKNFVNHPEWKRMSSDPQYANSVSNIIRVFLTPTDYSEI